MQEGQPLLYSIFLIPEQISKPNFCVLRNYFNGILIIFGTSIDKD